MTDAGTTWRVLIVDDDEVDRESVRRALRRAGVSVEARDAASGEVALARLAEESFDCVFLDYNLPGADGLTLLAAIRRAGHHVPVIALTGHGDEQVAVQLMKAGAADYVPKSAATPERLASSLRYATELSRAESHARVAEQELRASEARARFLAEASAVLARSLDIRATLEQVAQLSVPILGDYCLIYLQGADGAHGVASAHHDPSRQDLARLIERRFRPRADHPSSGVVRVMRTGETLVMNEIPDAHLDALADTAEERAAYAALAPRSALFAPLVARTIFGAVVFCRGVDRHAFTPMEVSLAEDLARRAAVALENARLFHDAEQARDRTERLQRVTAALSAVLSQQEAAQLFVSQARDALDAAGAWLALLSDEGSALRAVASDGYDQPAIAQFGLLSVDAPLPLRDTIRSGQPRWFASKDELVREYPALGDAVTDLEQEAVLVLPVTSGREVMGAMTIGFREERTLSTDEIALATALAQQCAQALERARLYEAERIARADAEAARRDAEEANRAKSEFLARMSHDLRTPLNAIGGYAQLIEEGIYGEPTSGQRESLARIRRAQVHLLTLINDVLSFAKLEAGQVRVRSDDVPLKPMFEELASLIEPQATAKGISLDRADVPPHIQIRGDRDRLTQILLNLLTNAVKFTDPGGRIGMSTEGRPGAIAIRVSDTGRGIPADRLEAVFNPFVQSGDSRDDERQGVGLGLAIGRELARMMGGELTVESAVGRGSTFTVVLPVGAATPEPTPLVPFD